MHITAYCPSCRSRYQLDAGLRGQRIRCPNPVCREIFDVRESEPEGAKPSPTDGNPPAPPLEDERGEPARPQRQADNPTSTVTTGSVGDLVPFLEAEVVHEVPPPVSSAEAPPTPIEVQEARHWQPEAEDDAKPIPVDPSLLPPPIEVENLVPLEPDEEARATPVQEAASWHLPPPVRNPDALHTRPSEAETPPPAGRAETPAEPRRTRKSKTLPALPAQTPEEAPPSWQTAPPVRRSPSQSPIEPSPLASASPSEAVQPQRLSPDTSYDTTTAPSGTSRRVLWIIGAMVVVAGFLIATVTVVTLNAYFRTEGNLYAQAKREYDEGKYGSAAKTFENLATDFPNSENRALYGMLAELSHVRDQVYTAQADPDEAHAAAGRFLAAYNSSPSLKGYRPDLWQTLGKLAEQLAVLAKQQRDPATLAKAKETRDQSRRFKPADRGDPDEAGKLIALAEAEIAYGQKKQQMLARLNGWMQTPSVQAVKDARQLAKQQGLDKDAEINQGIAQLDTAVRLTVRYVANEPGAVPVAAEALDPSLLIVPAVIRPAKPAP
ncbi:MAG TPA: outer membrane protein assembly factor BamD, partial [Gemmataceae bacterium]|nr:outer membrane protein assembly factor BamD [Gemmataceae bacterium]